MTQFSQDYPVRDLVARADRYRRARTASLRLRTLAPAAALVCLLLAVTNWLLGVSPWIAVGALSGCAVAATAYLVLQGRLRPTSDAIASAVDADAGLAGELRSAHWFEAETDRDDWSAYHLKQATSRAQDVNWASLYPRVKSARAWVATGALAAGVVAFAVRVPARTPAAAASGNIFAKGQPGAMLPAELQEKLAALLAQLDQSRLQKDEKAAAASLADIKDLLSKLDPATQKKLEELLAKRTEGLDKEKMDMAKLAEDQRADRAENSTAGLPEDVKWALDNDAQRAAQGDPNRKTNEKNPSATTKTGEKGVGSPEAEMEKGGAPAPAMVKESASDPGGKMMMSAGGPMGGDSRPGAGGNSENAKGAAEALLVAQALKKELVEANADALGENVDKEDLRRKTEQGKSTLGFSRVAPPSSYEPSRAAAPPPVPEARRPLLHSWFIRKQ